MEKSCTRCGANPVARSHNSWCRPCLNTYRRGRYPHKPEAYRLREYGLSGQDVREMGLLQGGRCDICERSLRAEHVDHDHATGAVRGLLCGPCNRGLGLFGDDPARLTAAASYLKRWSA